MIASLSPASPSSAFEECFPLRNPAHRILGFSLPSYLASTSSPTATADSLSLLTSTPSLLAVTVHPSASSGRLALPDKTRKLQTRLEQAVFFGTAQGVEGENPLAFKLQHGFEGDLAKAAERLSAEILASSTFRCLSFLRIPSPLAGVCSTDRS